MGAKRLLRIGLLLGASLVMSAYYGKILSAQDSVQQSVSGLYAANAAPGGVNSITVYALEARGDVAPLRAIQGPRTGLHQPRGMALDAVGNLYVCNTLGNSITVYAPGASGNIAPLRTIQGAHTGLNSPTGVAVDAAGNVYVSNEVDAFQNDSVTVYAPGANGNIAPLRTLQGSNTGLLAPVDIALDAAGNLYVDNSAIGPMVNQDATSITVYAPGANGNVVPLRTIHGSRTGLYESTTGLGVPVAIAVDAAGNLYVRANGVLVYSPGANGNVAPLRMIRGDRTGLANGGGVALDKASLYVSSLGLSSADNKITVYPLGANGNVAPLRTLQGPSTALNSPMHILVRQ